MNHTLELVRAGAGSGKTTDLCRTVAQAVADGLDPARILATTFTKKAAAELKGRILIQLLTAPAERRTDVHQQADRLEFAAIGTVHSVAHQLLSRYAIEMGLSPRLEVIAEGAGERS
ncbi:UvrD-helicase domain-containing protein, partial [Planctomycetota bacterium]